MDNIYGVGCTWHFGILGQRAGGKPDCILAFRGASLQRRHGAVITLPRRGYNVTTTWLAFWHFGPASSWLTRLPFGIS